jgi:predicted SnoaL-like aldol condensation-catalyzing enzyme
MVGGPRLIIDKEAKRATKAAAREFVDTVLVRGETERFDELVDMSSFRSHNPRIPGGGASLCRLIEAEQACADPMRYLKVHDIVGCANFAAAFSTIEFRGRLYEACDLFRVDDGLISEHWDIAEASDQRLMFSNDRAV